MLAHRTVFRLHRFHIRVIRLAAEGDRKASEQNHGKLRGKYIGNQTSRSPIISSSRAEKVVINMIIAFSLISKNYNSLPSFSHARITMRVSESPGIQEEKEKKQVTKPENMKTIIKHKEGKREKNNRISNMFLYTMHACVRALIPCNSSLRNEHDTLAVGVAFVSLFNDEDW